VVDYRLGHLTFAKLKQLALNDIIPKKLGLLNPPKCAGCLFGVMTKIPWRSKESKSSHKVFAATKPGETVSVDQMVSTKLGVLLSSTRLRSSPPSTAFASTTTTVTMAFMLTMPSRNHARAVVRDLPSVG
jgi:hypothetical protein